MKKLIAVLSLLVLMVPVFALNAGVTTSDVLKDYPWQVGEQAKDRLGQVVDSLNVVTNAVERGYKLTGPEERNQYGTKIREQLEKDYAALYAVDDILASYVYLTMIRPVSQDIECEWNEALLTKKIEKAKIIEIPPLAELPLLSKEQPAGEMLIVHDELLPPAETLLKRVKSAKKVIESLGDQDDMICQFILTTMADPLKEMSVEEATIEAAVYGTTIKVHGIPLAKYIEQQALRLNWPEKEVKELESFGNFLQESVRKQIESL